MSLRGGKRRAGRRSHVTRHDAGVANAAAHNLGVEAMLPASAQHKDGVEDEADAVGRVG